ncbi:hypothetical protein B0H16DRAFT_1690878 [Mycena metata]|uniref:MATH domain-containing protein n=1 Tax=Mycena metata TaxID=1033252 RepID=A0AAD7NB25_9AGAR|nr:hypothetical protein B0H16DRAFT_1690878 [Mycena metata]
MVSGNVLPNKNTTPHLQQRPDLRLQATVRPLPPKPPTPPAARTPTQSMMLGTWTEERLGVGAGGNPNMAGPQVVTDGVVSVRDRDAAAQYMPQLDHNVTDSTVYAWRLQNWKKSEKKLTSDEFWCGGHKWRILLFPFGNSTTPDETVSIYLDCVGPKQLSENWHACVQFALVISNIHDPTVFTASHAQHRFIAEESDWGFTRFSDLGKLFNPQGHSSRPTIEEDAADITAYLRVVDDPTGVLWHNFINYDSKKETGYVGLKNQGATAYMDSLLQLLFCIHYFRRAVYQIPTEDDLPTESVALALQRVFYHLQTSDNPVGKLLASFIPCPIVNLSVGTTELTKSFGWKALDSFIAHDVHEFSRVLLDKMESKMKDTIADGAIAKLFSGKMKSYIKCVHVDYEASRIEEFSDIQLNVKGMKNLYESFKDYVAVETYDGENKYLAEGFGLQDAKKGIIFRSFPPVLRLHISKMFRVWRYGRLGWSGGGCAPDSPYRQIATFFDFPFLIQVLSSRIQELKTSKSSSRSPRLSRLSNTNSVHPGPTAPWSRRSLRRCGTQVAPKFHLNILMPIDGRSAPQAPHFLRCAADIRSGGLDRSKHRASTAPCTLAVSPPFPLSAYFSQRCLHPRCANTSTSLALLSFWVHTILWGCGVSDGLAPDLPRPSQTRNILLMQLKRYDYGMQRDSMVKLNDRHEFTPEIDLGGFPWCRPPDRENRWFKYDDDRVTRATDKQVFEDNYGGKALDGLPSTAQFNQVKASKDFSSNAYVLVYIRESAIDQVLAPCTDEDIPPHIKARLDEEHLQLEAMKRERELQDPFITAKDSTWQPLMRRIPVSVC